jgi:hypothetical protein
MSKIVSPSVSKSESSTSSTETSSTATSSTESSTTSSTETSSTTSSATTPGSSFFDKYMPSTIVKRITPADLSSTGDISDTSLCVVFFYSPEGRFSYDFADQLTKLVYTYKINGYALDVSGENSTALKSKNMKFSFNDSFQIPSIIVYLEGKQCINYTGERTADKLYEFLKLVTSATCVSNNTGSTSVTTNTDSKSFFKKYWWVFLIVLIVFIIICVLIGIYISKKNSTK